MISTSLLSRETVIVNEVSRCNLGISFFAENRTCRNQGPSFVRSSVLSCFGLPHISFNNFDRFICDTLPKCKQTVIKTKKVLYVKPSELYYIVNLLIAFAPWSSLPDSGQYLNVRSLLFIDNCPSCREVL